MRRTSATIGIRKPLSRRLLAWPAAILILSAQPGLAWGPEGHRAVVILAQRYLRPHTLAQMKALLGAESPEDAALWADDIAHSSRPETKPWHYIDIPLNASSVNLRRDCPQGDCILMKTQEFLATLGDSRAGAESRSEALKFVLHFVADLHQPLHCEDHHDAGGNKQEVLFEGHPDNLHWVWDTGLVEAIDRDPNTLAADLGRRITAQDLAAWRSGSLEDWVLESHRLAQTVAYRRRWALGAAVLDQGYDERAEAAVRVQLERAGVRLAYLLNQRLP